MNNSKGNNYLRESYISHEKKVYRKTEKKESHTINTINSDMQEMMFCRNLL